jgi:hypothetical protein
LDSVTVLVLKTGHITASVGYGPTKVVGKMTLTHMGNYIAEWVGLDGIKHTTYPRLTAEDACKDVVRHDYPNARFVWGGSAI